MTEHEEQARELEPCPFCGGEAERFTIEEPGRMVTREARQSPENPCLFPLIFSLLITLIIGAPV